MTQARIMFDFEKHGEDQLGGAVRRLPPGGQLVLAGSGLALLSIPGSARRFQVRIPPKITERPEINFDAFRAATTATPELIRVHKEIMEKLQQNVPPEWRENDPDDESAE